MSQQSYSTRPVTAWQQPYKDAIDTLDGVALDARGYQLESPLPLAYQLKFAKVRELICELSDLDPRNGQEPLQLIAEHSQSPIEMFPPFKIGDRVFCRHLRTTGEIKAISLSADEAPQARILSLHNGKLTYNWVSMNDLEAPPLAKQQESTTGSPDTPAIQASVSHQPILSPASPAA